MNLVEVAQWIQEGYKEYYAAKKANISFIEDGTIDKKFYVKDYVMKKGRGSLNPKTIEDLIDLETSVFDENGMMQI